MAIYKQTRISGQAFDGLTAAKGRFDPGTQGTTLFQTRCNTIKFTTPGSAVLVEIFELDPDDATNKVLVFSDTGRNIMYPDYLLMTLANRKSGIILVETGTLDDDGVVTIDYDLEVTEG